MKRMVTAAVLAALVLACGQKAEQRPAQQTQAQTQTQQQPQTGKQEPPRPAIKQSDARVWIDPVTAAKGSTAAIKVQYYGVEEAKAIVIPLVVPSGVTIDSVSYAGSILEFIATRPINIDNDNHRVLFTAIPTTEPNIPAKEGLLGTVYVTIGPNAESGDIEETFFPPGNYLTYVDTANALIEPHFQPGKLTVQ
ncbi:MAG TPA: hypothetical protein VNN55_09410 [bacterium]|nr:hypothetical protein [bacterium]